MTFCLCVNIVTVDKYMSGIDQRSVVVFQACSESQLCYVQDLNFLVERSMVKEHNKIL